MAKVSIVLQDSEWVYVLEWVKSFVGPGEIYHSMLEQFHEHVHGKHVPEEATVSVAECDNCEWVGPIEQVKSLIEVHHLGERLDPGSTVPEGECPECGAFAYGKKKKKKDEPVHQHVEDTLEWIMGRCMSHLERADILGNVMVVSFGDIHSKAKDALSSLKKATCGGGSCPTT